MSHLNVSIPGVQSQIGVNRKQIVRVISGDTWQVSVNLYDPTDRRLPASPETTFVEVVLAETQFDKPLWKGGWYEGVTTDARPGLFHINIPREVTSSLRRGSYMFAVRVYDMLKTTYGTEAEGSFLVEYKTTSENHSIPYKDGSEDEDTVKETIDAELRKTVTELANKLGVDITTKMWNIRTLVEKLYVLFTDEDKTLVTTIKKHSLTPEQKAKLDGIESGAQVNKIESVTVNGKPQQVSSDRNVAITIDVPPEVTKETIQSWGFAETSEVRSALSGKIDKSSIAYSDDTGLLKITIEDNQTVDLK